MLSPKILGLEAKMLGIAWAVQNCTENAKFLGSRLASHDLTHWVLTQPGLHAGYLHSALDMPSHATLHDTHVHDREPGRARPRPGAT